MPFIKVRKYPKKKRLDNIHIHGNSYKPPYIEETPFQGPNLFDKHKTVQEKKEEAERLKELNRLKDELKEKDDLLKDKIKEMDRLEKELQELEERKVTKIPGI